jgi:hypothetical protein
MADPVTRVSRPGPPSDTPPPPLPPFVPPDHPQSHRWLQEVFTNVFNRFVSTLPTALAFNWITEVPVEENPDYFLDTESIFTHWITFIRELPTLPGPAVLQALFFDLWTTIKTQIRLRDLRIEDLEQNLEDERNVLVRSSFAPSLPS